MTPRARPEGGGDARACAACDAQLAADQRWCLACGARVPGADPAALLAPLAARHLGASPTAPPPPAGAGPAAASPRAGAAGATGAAGTGPSPAQPLDAAAADAVRTAQFARRRRAAAPLALAALVGVLVAGAGASTAPAGLSQQPFTVVLPPLAQVAQTVADDPPPADEAPLDDTFAEEPLDETPIADEEPAAEEPAEETPAEDDDPAGGDDEAPADVSPIKHVFLVVLASTDVAALAADEAKAPYLAGTLAKSGTLLTDYRAVARGSLANRIALVSGQGPTQQTLADCPPGTGAAPADVSPADPLADGQTGGDGCVYGFETGTIADQLKGAGRTWRAYVEPAAGAAAARGPAARAAAAGPAVRTAAPTAPGPAARAAAACLPEAATSRRNPFAWFRGHAEADDCARANAPLAQLARDLEDPETTPALSFVASDAQAGSAEADAFLERVVPQIQNSLAYANGGLIVITSDQPPAVAPTPAPAPADPPAPPTLDPPATTPTPDPAPPAQTTPDPAPPAQTTPEPAPTPSTTTPAPPTATTPQPPAATASTASAAAPPATAPRAPAARVAATPPAPPWPATYPNVGDAAAAGAGATVGALLISPFTPAGRRDATAASHFTLLRTLSAFFALDPLGYAAAENVKPLPDALFDSQP